MVHVEAIHVRYLIDFLSKVYEIFQNLCWNSTVPNLVYPFMLLATLQCCCGWGQKIDVGVGCWRHNMLVTSLRLTFWSPRSSIPSSLSGSSISQVSSISKFCHRHPKIVTNTKMSPKLLWWNNPKYETEPIYTNMNFGQSLSGQMLNLLWLKIIIYDYDMIILGRI